MEYRYVGQGGYVVGIPARDLTGADLVEIEEREGITREDVELSGLYAREQFVEVAPFCGAVMSGERCRAANKIQQREMEKFCGGWLEDGGRCRAGVTWWGERCELHQGKKPGYVASLKEKTWFLTEVRGIGVETARILELVEVGGVEELAGMTDETLVEIAEEIPRISERMLVDWRAQARRMMDGDGTESI